MLFAFSTENAEPWKGPERFTQARLAELFSPKAGWLIESVTPELYEIAPDVKIGFRETQLRCHRLVAHCL